MSTWNALKGPSICFIAIPEYLHVTEITWAKQGRHFSKYYNFFTIPVYTFGKKKHDEVNTWLCVYILTKNEEIG